MYTRKYRLVQESGVFGGYSCHLLERVPRSPDAIARAGERIPVRLEAESKDERAERRFLAACWPSLSPTTAPPHTQQGDPPVQSPSSST